MFEKIINNIKNLLSNKKWTVVIVIISVLSRILQLLYFFNIRQDMSLQVIATKNFVAGHGITVDTVNPGDLSTIIYTPLIKWPPGFSIILSPFYLLTGGNYLYAGLLLSITAAIVLIIYCRKILAILDTPLYLVNFYTLIAGFFIYFFYLIASSDAVMVSIFSIAVYYMLLLLKSQAGLLRKTIIISICLFICAGIKYLFVPVVFIIPLFLILKGSIDKITTLKKAGVISFVLLLLFIGGMLLWQKNNSGAVGYITEPGRGFFPDHLVSSHPFVPGSIIRTETISLLFNNNQVLLVILLRIFQLLQILFIVYSLIYLFRSVQKNGIKNMGLQGCFFITSFLVSFCIAFILTILSLSVQSETWGDGSLWTYVQDQRYYAVPNILIQLCLFSSYNYFKKQMKKPTRYFYYLAFLLLVVEMGRGAIFDVNRIKEFKSSTFSWQEEYKFQKFADSLITEQKKKNHRARFAVAGSTPYFNIRVSIYSHIPQMDKTTMINDLSTLNSKEPVILLVVIQNKFQHYYQPFLNSKNKRLAGTSGELSFYFTNVTPH
jgi:hypothetical protein